jgi:hypothetical protein
LPSIHAAFIRLVLLPTPWVALIEAPFDGGSLRDGKVAEFEDLVAPITLGRDLTGNDTPDVVASRGRAFVFDGPSAGIFPSVSASASVSGYGAFSPLAATDVDGDGTATAA